MPSQGKNQGIHMLDDFVREAIPVSPVIAPETGGHARNEGMAVGEKNFPTAAKDGNESEEIWRDDEAEHSRVE